MTIYLSENLKKLRRGKDLTQEKLAEHLGVTFQSVSNWERGESYPDITMLPEIAAFFSVSTDELLGLSKAKAQEKIQEYLDFYSTMRFKDTPLTYEKFQQAVKDFPSDFSILVRYMELLMCEKTDKDAPDFEKVSQELTSIYENIQSRCTDNSIRMWSKRLICQHLHTKAHYTGNEEYQLKAEKILEEMPDMINTREYLSTMLISDKDKHYKACSTAIESNLFLLENTVTHYCFYDENFTPGYKIEAIKKMIDINNIIFTDGNYGKLWINMIYNYGHLGYLYFIKGDIDNALKNLKLSADYAKKYDALPGKSERTSQFFENTIFEKTPRGKTMCQRMKYLMTQKYPLSDEFRESKEFAEIISSLE